MFFKLKFLKLTFGRLAGRFGSSLGSFGVIFGRLGGRFGSSWGVLGASWAVLGGLGASWGGLGAPREAPGWLLGRPWAIQNRSKNRSETCFENEPNRDGKKWPKHYACRCFRA